MEEISLHILDIAENSIRAGARTIEIVVTRDEQHNVVRVEVNDDGTGMDAETLARVRDPFFSTKGKKTGLGIPLLSQAADQAAGRLTLTSTPEMGTRVAAEFQWNHIDRPPMGNMAETLLTLIAGHPDRDYIYTEREWERSFRFDTREIKADLGEVPISDPDVLSAIRELLQENMRIV